MRYVISSSFCSRRLSGPVSDDASSSLLLLFSNRPLRFQVDDALARTRNYHGADIAHLAMRSRGREGLKNGQGAPAPLRQGNRKKGCPIGKTNDGRRKSKSKASQSSFRNPDQPPLSNAPRAIAKSKRGKTKTTHQGCQGRVKAGSREAGRTRLGTTRRVNL